MFERFTDPARSVLSLALEEATALGHGFIGTEHILLGLLRQDDGVAATTLRSFGISLDDTRTKVRGTVGAVPAPGEQTVYTPRSKMVLELALREALRLGHDYIGTEHLLLALVREGDGLAAQILRTAGATRARVGEEVLTLLGMEAPPDVEASRGTAAWRRPAAWRARMASVPVPLPAPPRCPRCSRGLADTAAYRVLDVEGDNGDETVKMIVVYCRACGRALGTAS